MINLFIDFVKNNLLYTNIINSKEFFHIIYLKLKEKVSQSLFLVVQEHSMRRLKGNAWQREKAASFYGYIYIKISHIHIKW